MRRVTTFLLEILAYGYVLFVIALAVLEMF
jgi:hypothetical protein